jgi:zinc-finger of transposase IS204/IS1001/IS1096/IS1165
MQDHATRLVGLDGLVVTGVQRVGEQLDLQVELLARAAGCPHCGGSDVRVKERPRVRVRDLPIAGRVTRLCGASAATAAATVRGRSPRPMSSCRPVSG